MHAGCSSDGGKFPRATACPWLRPSRPLLHAPHPALYRRGTGTLVCPLGRPQCRRDGPRLPLALRSFDRDASREDCGRKGLSPWRPHEGVEEEPGREGEKERQIQRSENTAPRSRRSTANTGMLIARESLSASTPCDQLRAAESSFLLLCKLDSGSIPVSSRGQILHQEQITLFLESAIVTGDKFPCS